MFWSSTAARSVISNIVAKRQPFCYAHEFLDQAFGQGINYFDLFGLFVDCLGVTWRLGLASSGGFVHVSGAWSGITWRWGLAGTVDQSACRWLLLWLEFITTWCQGCSERECPEREHLVSERPREAGISCMASAELAEEISQCHSVAVGCWIQVSN